jgi:hypothetical protein
MRADRVVWGADIGRVASPLTYLTATNHDRRGLRQARPLLRRSGKSHVINWWACAARSRRRLRPDRPGVGYRPGVGSMPAAFRIRWSERSGNPVRCQNSCRHLTWPSILSARVPSSLGAGTAATPPARGLTKDRLTTTGRERLTLKARSERVRDGEVEDEGLDLLLDRALRGDGEVAFLQRPVPYHIGDDREAGAFGRGHG